MEDVIIQVSELRVTDNLSRLIKALQSESSSLARLYIRTYTIRCEVQGLLRDLLRFFVLA